MAKSSVLISFSGNPTNGETFTIFSDKSTDIVITFKDSPSLVGDCQIAPNSANTNINLKAVIDSAYNSLSEYTLTLETSTSLKVESTIDNTVFTKDESGFSSGSLTISNETVITPIVIESYGYFEDEQDSAQCGLINIGIQTNININEYTINGGSVVTGSDTTYQIITIPRESEVTIVVTNDEQSSDVEDTLIVSTPLKVDSVTNYATYNFIYLPDSVTLNIQLDENPPYPYPFNYTWTATDENTVTSYTSEIGLLNVNIVDLPANLGGIEYNVKAKETGDSLCETSFDNYLTTSEDISSITDVSNPFFEISESNSLTYYYDEVIDDIDIYKTEFNSRSCEEDTQIAEGITQLYMSSDIVRTQFWSNYEDSVAYALKPDGTKVYFDINLDVQNIGLNDKRDCRIFDLGNNQMGVYFTSGDIYTYGTSTVIGEYSLNGFLPEWGIVGNYAYIDEVVGWLEIVNVIYDQDKGADVLVFDYYYGSADAESKISTIYNREVYNVYSFDTTMINIKDELSVIKIENTDSRNLWTDVFLTSESVLANQYVDNCVEFIYFDYNNTSDMYYYGLDFYNIVRLEYEVFSSNADSEKEVEKTDKTAITQSTRNYPTKLLSLKSIPTKYMRKLTQAFSHKEIFINRIQYSVDDVEVSEQIGSTNTYTMDIKLIAAESIYNPLLDRSYVGNIKVYHTLGDIFAIQDGNDNLIQDGNDNILITG